MKTKLMFFGLGAIIGGALAGLSVYIWQKREIDALTEALEGEMLRRNEENQTNEDEILVAVTQLEGFVQAVNLCPIESAKRTIIKRANDYISENIPDDVCKRRNWVKDTPDIEDEEETDDEQELLRRAQEDFTMVVEDPPVEELIGPPPPETDEDAPYVIDKRDYLGNPDDYKQEVLMYFAFDDSLVDEDDDLVDQDETVGADNLFAFTDTDDPAIFIRNDRLRIMYEVIWENDAYAVRVLGQRPLKHYAQRIYRDAMGEYYYEEEEE